MKPTQSSDKIFIGVVIALTSIGFLAFVSASLGLFVRDNINVAGLIFNQALFGILGGGIAFIITYFVNYKIWGKISLWSFIFSLLLTLLVFVPGIGFEHGGARRWLDLQFITFQPAELLKYTTVIFTAVCLIHIKNKKGWRPFIIISAILGLTGITLLAQPDTDSYAVIFISIIIMVFAAGRPLKEVFGYFGYAVIGIIGIMLFRPYIRDRVLTFFDPSRDPFGSSYQIQQSLVAIGSGGLTGRGFGQSVQKFGYLPEPIGDSIFAVLSEEFGLIGTIALLSLFFVFILRALKIAKRTKDSFGYLLIIGITAIIVSQAFINIASMLGLIPLSGITLPFVSHGGSALFMLLGACGIIAHISRYKKL
jgi:cell division protein FtsW